MIECGNICHAYGVLNWQPSKKAMVEQTSTSDSHMALDVLFPDMPSPMTCGQFVGISCSIKKTNTTWEGRTKQWLRTPMSFVFFCVFFVFFIYVEFFEKRKSSVFHKNHPKSRSMSSVF